MISSFLGFNIDNISVAYFVVLVDKVSTDRLTMLHAVNTNPFILLLDILIGWKKEEEE